MASEAGFLGDSSSDILFLISASLTTTISQHCVLAQDGVHLLLGQEAHGAFPQHGFDAITLSAQVIQAMAAEAGFDAVLVGETLVTSGDPAAAIRDLANIEQ